MDEQRKQLIVNLIVGLLLCVLVIAIGWVDGARWSQRFCDGTFTAGILLLGSGLLHHFSNIGLFRVMSYGIKVAWETAVPWMASHRGEDFDAYRERKAENLKSPRAIIISGVVYLVLSLVLLAIYYLFPAI